MEVNVKRRNNFFYIIIVFILTHTLKTKRNPFCALKKERVRSKNSLILLATGCINQTSLAVATIKNGNSIGHYKIGDCLSNLIIMNIKKDVVLCRNKEGKTVFIYP